MSFDSIDCVDSMINGYAPSTSLDGCVEKTLGFYRVADPSCNNCLQEFLSVFVAFDWSMKFCELVVTFALLRQP